MPSTPASTLAFTPRPRVRSAPKLHLAIACLTWLLACVSQSSAAERPNVLVILTDDQGWGDLSVNGNTNLATPRIDSLARDGARFERFFVCPVCSPTRAEFLTGRYHPRSNVYSTSAGGERMDLDERTIADVFRGAGYATAAFGKWHNGMQYPYHPNARGFDEYYGFCSGHWGDYFSPPLEHNGQLVQGNGFVIDDFTERAMAFIESHHREQPFFVYLPYNTPHSPMQVPDRFWKKFANADLAMRNREPNKENLQHTRAALAMCENIDWNVGRLLDKLDALQISDNTIVVYFCDNGPNGVRWNGDMKGRKGATDEGGVRSPLLIRWPGKIGAAQVVTPISAAIDLLPTLSQLAGVPVTPHKPLDGVSMAPLLVGDKSAVKPERLIFSHWRDRVSVRSQQFRLDHQGQLFDIAADPGQRTDISAKHPEETARLKQAVEQWRSEVLAECDPANDDRPFPLGHPDYRYTQIPARDGVTRGGIVRSNRFPNCSYFTNWKSTDDRISWDVEVGADGEYEVEMHYACPADSVGSLIELSLGDARLRATISEPHDPPVRGGEHDRLERAESYVKDFRPMKLGTIKLSKGRGKLSLRAVEMPGKQVGEFRLLMFTRVAK
ncbi:MAG: arylsulfatase [Planctomycetales bacterium]|nr:arylsulfatase [Planctomycetales bacterium]